MHHLFRLGLSGPLLVWSAACGAAPAADPSRSESLLDLAGNVQGAVLEFFDSATGARAASLRIERIRREYGRQGLFHVAWKPQVVLEGSVLQIDNAAAWPRAAAHALAALPFNSAASAVVFRGFRLQLNLPGQPVLRADEARLTADGKVELIDATLTAAHCPPRMLPRAVVPLARPTPAVWSGSAAEAPSRPHLFSHFLF